MPPTFFKIPRVHHLYVARTLEATSVRRSVSTALSRGMGGAAGSTLDAAAPAQAQQARQYPTPQQQRGRISLAARLAATRRCVRPCLPRPSRRESFQAIRKPAQARACTYCLATLSTGQMLDDHTRSERGAPDGVSRRRGSPPMPDRSTTTIIATQTQCRMFSLKQCQLPCTRGRLRGCVQAVAAGATREDACGVPQSPRGGDDHMPPGRGAPRGTRGRQGSPAHGGCAHGWSLDALPVELARAQSAIQRQLYSELFRLSYLWSHLEDSPPREL